ncbi:uncharacterized protein ACLA_050360 [Aspergillus clavatus NRRL 1]|uniref:Uncharacterized protein n=1 Tax=Aspergillus clavatus (strain ATCC 1007 / CBS 513.65 / DSM 816 / NCTC 3887 / NRRL 1 / QM 1276 / 107) TaxID=344612 RepID=A1CI59_ASPCL|nr:uncharacterized protein ACLA_050360 [Aspergillus clavatus NRRL 1]EAW10564.1 conserved hypothetical protein [Aspergillus clavatus NRRL 1]
MSLTPVDSLASDDDDHSTVAPAPGRTRATRSQSVKKQPSRPKTTYQLAHPASHARHRRLKFRPKLLLQLQRVSPSTRPLPILDVLPSTVFLPRLARRFPTIFRGKKGLGPYDLIIVMSDLYERTPGDIASKYLGPNDEDNEHREVVATICQMPKEDGALSQGKAEICLIQGPVWEATPLANGSYEFRANTDQGVQVLRWVSRGGKSRRVSAPPGSPLQEDAKRFTFSVIDPNTRRHPVIAAMTRNVLEVYDEYSTTFPQGDLPTTPTCGMSVVSDSSELDTPVDRDMVKTGDDLRAIIIITSIWVAFREGWSRNFTYDDTVLSLNSKAICSPAASRQSSPVAVRGADELLSEDRDKYPDGPSLNSIRNRLPGSTTFPSHSSNSSEWARSTKYASLPRRSKSTGAAFIERSNRRSASASENQPQRHSMLPIAQESDRAVAEDPRSSRGLSSPSQSVDPRDTGKPDRAIDKPAVSTGRSRKQSTASTEKSNKPLGSQGVDPAPSKGKRRHRFSGFFDFFTRKSGHP